MDCSYSYEEHGGLLRPSIVTLTCAEIFQILHHGVSSLYSELAYELSKEDFIKARIGKITCEEVDLTPGLLNSVHSEVSSVLNPHYSTDSFTKEDSRVSVCPFSVCLCEFYLNDGEATSHGMYRVSPGHQTLP